MTLPEDTKEDRAMSIAQFEELYRGYVVLWLMEHEHCQQREAERLSALIMGDLKAKCPAKKTYSLSIIWQIIHKFTQRELLKTKKLMDKNFGLAEPAFNDLLSSLQRGDDVLFEQLFLSHFKDCVQYLQRHYNASYEDAYDTTMETMLEFFKRLKAGKVTYGNLRFLFTQMAGQIYLKWIKKENKKSRLEYFDLGEAPNEGLEQETLLILQKSWDGLCDNCRELLKKYYYEGITLKAMAELLNKTPAALRKQKQRCVEKLRGLFSKYA